MNNHLKTESSLPADPMAFDGTFFPVAGRAVRGRASVWRGAWLGLLLLAGGSFLAPAARAGLTLEMDVIRYHQYGYYFYPNLMTNNAAPMPPFGNYYIASYGYLTNGSWAAYQFDTNGFNWQGGGDWGYGDYAGMLHELTNGLWSISVTNATMTNVYHFAVTVNISSNDLPYVPVFEPADGAVNVPTQPTFEWWGPTNYSDLIIYCGPQNTYLPVTQTNYSGFTLLQGTNSFTPHYDSYPPTGVVSATPVDSGANAISAWSYTTHLQDYSQSTFTVGAADTTGTRHTLVAHFPFDATNGFVLNAGQDTSGNGYNLSFGEGYGAEGGSSLTNDAAAGIGAVVFDDGDGNSGGVLGWSPSTPAAVLSALAGSFSVSCWIKTTQNLNGWDQSPADEGAGIISADLGYQANDTIPMALTGGTIGFNTGGSIEDDTLNSANTVNDGNYHFIVVTRNQTTGQKIIYVDGNFDSFASGTTNLLSDPQMLSIGALGYAGNSDPNNSGYYNGYDGELDDLQIYSGVLSATDVTNLFASPGTTIPNGGGATDFNLVLGTTNLVWTTSGDSAWFAEATNTYNGSPMAAESGSVINFQSSVLSTTVTGPGEVTFYWNSQDDCSQFDYEFDIDGGYQADIQCSPGWSEAGPFLVGAGQHTLSWTTYANGDTDPTEVGYLDGVTYVQGSAPVITINPFNQTNYPGYNVALYAGATSSPAATWQWYEVGSGAPISNATNALYIPGASGTASVAGQYYAVASNLFGTAMTATAAVSFASAALPPDWSNAFKSPMGNASTDATTNYNIACLLDGAGNIYSVGSTVGTNTFGSNTLVTVNGTYSTAILKQTTNGTAIWGLSMTNDGVHGSYAECVAAAPGGGCYVAGDFTGTNWLGTNLLADLGVGSTFLARIDANGNVLWVRTISGTNGNFMEYHELTSDAAGNAILSTLISGGTSLGTTNVTVDGQLGLLAAYDLNGNVRWLQVPSGWPNYLTCQGERLYGSMGGSATNYIGGVTNVSDRRRALFCLNATNGQAYWMQGLGSQIDQGNPSGFVDDNAMVAVSGTNIFVAGIAWGSNAMFGPLSVSFPTAKGEYLARYDTGGNPQLATTFGSPYLWPWAIAADGAGNVYVGGDFDTYAIFGNDIIAAPFYATVQYLENNINNRIPGQSFLAKFDRNGNPLWARLAESQSSYLNCRDIGLAADGIWSCGFFSQPSVFGSIDLFGGLTVVGSPIGELVWHPAGFLAEIDQVVPAQPVSLVEAKAGGGNFQFSFLSQSSYTNSVQYRTNLISGTSWQTYSNVAGDGTMKTILVPMTLFSPSKDGFIRVLTQ